MIPASVLIAARVCVLASALISAAVFDFGLTAKSLLPDVLI